MPQRALLLIFGVLFTGFAQSAQPQAPPKEFVCTSRVDYITDESGVLTIQRRAPVLTFTVNTRSGTVQGDLVASDIEWTVVDSGSNVNGAKLSAQWAGNEFLVLVIKTFQPVVARDSTTYPFTFFQASLGRVVTGSCRG